MQVEFAHDIGAVCVDGFSAEPQHIRDLLVGMAFGNEFQHFRLTRCEHGT